MKTIAFALAFLVGGAAFARTPAAGRPAYKANDPPAFFLWSDDAGWHLRVTNPKKTQHTFHGVIRGKGLREVKPSRPGLAAKQQSTDAVLRFEFDSFDGDDGFDWKSESECVTLELKLDGKADPAKIHVGANAASPTAMPFDACR